MRRAIFLDRDGVLNRAFVRNGKPYPPQDVSALEILPLVPEALERLRSAKFLLIVVTNQPDVARGAVTKDDVERINSVLKAKLPLDDFVTCYHDDADNCICRKPKPGLLLQARDKFGIDMARSFMVGDRWRDIAAGSKAGCQTVFINYHYNETQPEPGSFDFSCASLDEAVSWILSRPRQPD